MKNLYYILIFLFLFSCENSKKDNVKTQGNKVNNIKNIIVGNDKSMAFIFNFPDTIHLNKCYDGEIIYKSKLDTIIKSFDNDLHDSKSRYIYISYAKTNLFKSDEKDLRLIITDTIGAHDCHTIYLYKIKFDKLGVNYIDGIINDQVNFDIDKKDEKGHFRQRQITKEARATKKVFVIP